MKKITKPEQLDEILDQEESVEISAEALSKATTTRLAKPMGRPQKDPSARRVNIPIRVLPITEDLIRAEAKRRGISNGEVVDRVVQAALKLLVLLTISVAAFGAEPVSASWKRTQDQIMEIRQKADRDQEAAALRWAVTLKLNEVPVPAVGADARPSEVEAHKKAAWANEFMRAIKKSRDARDGHEIMQLMNTSYFHPDALKYFDEVTGAR